MILCPFLMALQTIVPPSGDVVINEVEGLLSGFGVPGPMRLQSVWVGTGESNSVGSVVVSDRDKNLYTAYLRPLTFAVYAVFKGKESEDYVGYPTKDLKDPRIERRLRGWATRVSKQEPIRLESVQSDGKRARAFFAILRNGYPFVAAAQRYGYSITITVPDCRFLFLMSQEDPPPVDNRRPVLKEADAIRAFNQIVSPEKTSQDPAHPWSTTYELTAGRELGYFLAKDEKLAKLVWKIPFMARRNVGYAIQGGSGAMLIDAITGQQVPSDTVP